MEAVPAAAARDAEPSLRSRNLKPSKEVDAYIAAAPKEVQSKLRELRAIFKAVAPDAEESISYMMPAYDKGKIGWFGLHKTHIGLYVRPPIIQEHESDLAAYATTKSAVHLVLDKKLPVALIKKLLAARIKRNAS